MHDSKDRRVASLSGEGCRRRPGIPPRPASLACKRIAICLGIFLTAVHGVFAQANSGGTAAAGAAPSQSAVQAQGADGGRDAAVLEKIGGITTGIGRMNDSVSALANQLSAVSNRIASTQQETKKDPASIRPWLMGVLIVACLTLLAQVIAYLVPRRHEGAGSRSALEGQSTAVISLVTNLKTMAADTQGRAVALEKTVECIGAAVKQIKESVSNPPKSVVPHVSDGQVVQELRSVLERVQPALAAEVGRAVSDELVSKAEGRTHLAEELKRVQAKLEEAESERTRAEEKRDDAITQMASALQETQRALSEKAGLEDKLRSAESLVLEQKARLEDEPMQRNALAFAKTETARLRAHRDQLRLEKGALDARVQAAEAAVAERQSLQEPDLETALRRIDPVWHGNGPLRGVYHACCALFQAAERRQHEMAREWIAGVDRAIVAAGGGDDRRIEGLRAALVDVINQRIQGCYRIEWPRVGTEFLPKRHVPEGPRGLSIAKVLSAVILSPSGDVVALARVQTV